ncbi:hypothetical protein ACFWDI_16505 [Streptomyces sp. NPDC060064]|uniref:hypothetical protein n=1 Tax=Streptomyces sp. NPDC060064 TaxID=3347049 RepID=UPI0036C497C9
MPHPAAMVEPEREYGTRGAGRTVDDIPEDPVVRDSQPIAFAAGRPDVGRAPGAGCFTACVLGGQLAMQ